MLVFVDNFTAKNSKVVLVNAVTPNFAVLICCNRLKGPFIFYKVGVAGGISGGGRCEKK